jgi:mannosyltransferase OCH1-like enzyme
MIPKIIHYCWFGNNEYSTLSEKCISSWKQLLTDYEFIKWDENNTILDNEYVKFAFTNKKWAYVSDYVRLKALYDYGGIYLDTDMLVLKSFDDLLNDQCFFGAENLNFFNAAIVGCQKNNEFIKEALDYYISMSSVDNKIFSNPIPNILTKLFRTRYIFNNNFSEIIEIDNIKIYPAEYFYPYPYNGYAQFDSEYLKYATLNTYAIHLWESSWKEKTEFELIKTRKYKDGFAIVIDKLIKEKIASFSYFKKIAFCIKESLIKKY